jgi:hypothetical protein
VQAKGSQTPLEAKATLHRCIERSLTIRNFVVRQHKVDDVAHERLGQRVAQLLPQLAADQPCNTMGKSAACASAVHSMPLASQPTRTPRTALEGEKHVFGCDAHQPAVAIEQILLL